MRWLKVIFVAFISLAVAGCASKFKEYSGPEVTEILVYKDSRKLYLMHNNEVLRTYDFELGFSPVGHKVQERDGRTPEGTYFIDRKNPNSSFHLSVGISYPNARDRARARALGVRPGGDIFIHGTPEINLGQRDWTAGCIAVTNAEIEEIYSMVNVGTIIRVYATSPKKIEEAPVQTVTRQVIQPQPGQHIVLQPGQTVVSPVSATQSAESAESTEAPVAVEEQPEAPEAAPVEAAGEAVEAAAQSAEVSSAEVAQ